MLFVTSFAAAEAVEKLRFAASEATASVSSFGFGGTNGHVVLASPAEAFSRKACLYASLSYIKIYEDIDLIKRYRYKCIYRFKDDMMM